MSHVPANGETAEAWESRASAVVVTNKKEKSFIISRSLAWFQPFKVSDCFSLSVKTIEMLMFEPVLRYEVSRNERARERESWLHTTHDPRPTWLTDDGRTRT